MNYSKDCNYFRCFYCVGLFPRFIFWFKRDIKKNRIFHIDFNDFHDLLLPYFSGCKNKKIKQKTNPAASKMKPFMTLVDDLFGKQLNNITKNPCFSIKYFKETCVIYSSFQNIFFTCLWQVKTACAEVRLRTQCALKQGAPFNGGIV